MDLGYGTSDTKQLFNELFDPQTGICRREGDYYPDAFEAAQAIHSAGGIAVLAHPLAYDSMELARELVQKQLIHGIEAYHPSVSDKQSAAVLEPFAREYGLIKTGGSDFHGSMRRSPCPIASRITAEDDINALFRLKNKRRGGV